MFKRLLRLLEELLEEIKTMVSLAFQTDSLELRLKRLRQIYYTDEKVTLRYRQVRDILRDKVAEAYHPYYEKILVAERTAYQMTRELNPGVRGEDILAHMQDLGEKIARLVEQLQHADKTIKLYTRVTTEANMVAESQVWLRNHIEEALEIHGSIPAKLMSFMTASAGRGLEKFSDRLARLTNRLDDILASYDDLDQRRQGYLREIMQEDSQE
jgi:chaperonin cofactor prefoldin